MCSLRVVIKNAQRVSLVNIHILNYVAHPFYHISVTALNAISIMLQTQLGPTSDSESILNGTINAN